MAKKGKHHHTAPASPAGAAAAHRAGRATRAASSRRSSWRSNSTSTSRRRPTRTCCSTPTWAEPANSAAPAISRTPSPSSMPASTWPAPTWPGWRQAALELAACGDARGASDLLARLPADSPARATIRAQAVDAALSQRSGRPGPRWPPSCTPISTASCRHSPRSRPGQDEAARDDAASHWPALAVPRMEGAAARLDRLLPATTTPAPWTTGSASPPTRLPARLAAPLRYLIDGPYRDAQSPEAQAALRKQADRLQGDAGAWSGCGRSRRRWPTRTRWPTAFRLAEGLLPLLRQQSPALADAPGLLLLLDASSPPAAGRRAALRPGVRRPPDDPTFAPAARPGLRGASRSSQEAHKEWQTFEKSVADHPRAWPPDRPTASVPSSGATWAAMPPPARPRRPRPAPLPAQPPGSPPAAQAGGRAVLRAEPQAGPRRAGNARRTSWSCTRSSASRSKAEQAARRLLERFPEHVPDP